MGAVYVLVIVVVVALVAAALMLRRLGREREARHEDVMRAPYTLRYDVPEGQDPAAVLVSLSRGGFEAAADPGNVNALTIMCPLGPEQREEVRVLLERETANTLEGQERGWRAGDPPPPEAARVRFVDER
jgi:hypothetical protein